MAADTHSDTPHDGETTPAFAANSDSMQNLLAQYLAQGAAVSDPDTDRFSQTHLHSLTSRHSETRALHAFAALDRHLSPPELPSASDDSRWPESARRQIKSLQSEIERLRAQVQAAETMAREAHELADRDVLTPTLNRRAFLREVHRAMADCRRYGEAACILYLDMDGFKAINDTYGHAAGDAALIHTAQTLLESIREGDSVGRMGGDEFAVLLRHADLASARIKAMKLEAELALSTFEHGGLYLTTGGSFGVRAYADQPSAEAWLSEADAAMFLVKKSSR